MAKRRWSPFRSTEPIRPLRVEDSSTGSSYTSRLGKHSEKWWFRLIAGVVLVLALLVGVAYLITNSDWGRERVRRYVEGLIQRNSHGIVHIGSVTGNLLHGMTLHNVVITDSAHAPFLKADEIWANYSLGILRSKRVDLRDVKLVRPVIVIDKQPGGKWNYDRIFPRDTATPAE